MIEEESEEIESDFIKKHEPTEEEVDKYYEDQAERYWKDKWYILKKLKNY